MKTYKEYKISTLPFDVDSLSGMLWQLDIDGINEFDTYLTIFVSENKDTTKNDIEGLLQHMINEKMLNSFEIEEQTFEEINWNEEYEKKVKVVEITDQIVIKPSFKEYESRPGQLIITIDPKMSFGTGEHATTKLILQFLEKYITGNEKVLDVGSGTGVLGIASVLLGAANAICVDNDEWCLLNGTENVKANSLEEKVYVRLGELKDISENNFNVIVANINKHILDSIAAELKAKIRKTGILILSGLLNTDEVSITQLYQSLGFRLKEKSEMAEWIALVFISE
jgi:ribosomal protein L11 methyltransferase